MLIPEFFVPDHLRREAGLLDILVQRLRISPDEDLHSYADEVEQMAARLRKIAGE